MKTLRRAVLILLVALLALFGVAVVFIVTFDINNLKPVIQKAAHEQGATLDIPGDLSWQFWPELALHLGAMTLRNDRGDSLAAMTSATLSVQLKPLLSHQILVDGLTIDGMQANYHVDARGQSNWQTILDRLAQPQPESTPQSQASPPDTDRVPKLKIRRIAINNLGLTYRNAQDNTSVKLSQTNLTSHDFTIDGNRFTVQLDTMVNYNNLPEIKLSWQSPMMLDLNKQTLAVNDGRGHLTLNTAQADFAVTTTTHWGEELNSNGQAELRSDNFRALLKALQINSLPTADQQNLKSMELRFRFDLSNDKLRIHDVKFHVDNTEVKGELSVENFAKPRIRSHWQGTKIDLTGYLTPPPQTPATPEAQQPPTAPVPLPLAAVRDLDLEFSLALTEVRNEQLTLSNPTIAINAKNGLVTLSELSGNLAGGSLRGQGVLDARKAVAHMDMTIDSQGIDLGKVLKTFAKLDYLTGKISADMQITSSGSTDQEFINNLQAHAKAQSDGLKLIPFNLEEQFCEAVALLQNTSPPAHDWPKQTLLEPVRLQLALAKDTLTVENLSAEVAHLLGSAQGQLNLLTGQFNFPFTLSLANFAQDIPGCIAIDEKWRTRALPIRCKGTLNTIGVKTCRPDTDLLKKILEDKVKAKLGKEQERVEEKLQEKAKKLLEKELGEDDAKKTEDALRGIFKQLKGK